MLNNCVCVGRLIGGYKEEGKNVYFRVNIPRPYKNEDGIYESDEIKCMAESGNLIENLREYCKEGDLLGIKGSLTITKDDSMYLKVEKVTFLSSRKENE